MTWAELGLGVAVFVLAAVYDAAFAVYVRAAATGRAVRAANCSVALCLVGALFAWTFIKVSAWYVVPEVAGFWIGTAAVVRWTRDHD